MDEMDCTPSHAQAIKMRQMSEAKTGGERLAKDALVSIMKEEKPNQKEQFKIPKEKISRFFAPGTPTQKIEYTIVKGEVRPFAGKRQLVPVPPLHTSPLPNNLNSLKKEDIWGAWMYIESSGLFSTGRHRAARKTGRASLF